MTQLASTPSRHSRTGALERVIRRAATRRQESEERCELCRVPVPPGHRHLLDTERGEVMCCCQACSLLFDEAASKGHYRLVPRRRVRLTVEELGDKKREGGVTKKILMVLSLLGLGALAVKEFPAMMREIKILRMGKAPQGPAWHQRAGGG